MTSEQHVARVLCGRTPLARLFQGGFGYRMRTRVLPAILVLALALAGPAGIAHASDLADFNEAAAVAYGHYRAAASYLRTGNAALAAIELEAAREKWRDVASRFAASPPDAFADDPAWAGTLTAIGKRLKDALAATDGGDLKAAAEILAPIRGELSDLRGRNNVVVFSDRVDAISAIMDRLWRFHHQPPDLDSAAALRELRSGTAVLEHLLRLCREAAPAGLRKDPDFVRFLDSGAEAVERLWQAIETKDQELLINTLRELRSFERLLFLRFG